MLRDIEYDENGNVIDYKTFNKIFFGGVKTIDKELLPTEVLNPTIECENSPIAGSRRPITSNAVYNVKAVLEMSKQDYIYVGYEAYNGYIVATVNGKLQVVHPSSLESFGGVSKSEFESYKSTIGVNLSRANTAYEAMAPIHSYRKLSKPENEGKIVAVVNGKLDLVDINDLIGGGTNA